MRAEQMVQERAKRNEKIEFIWVGNTPNTALFEGELELDEERYIVTDLAQRTSVPGVFAAGDVQEWVLRQIATAVGTGGKVHRRVGG